MTADSVAMLRLRDELAEHLADADAYNQQAFRAAVRALGWDYLLSLPDAEGETAVSEWMRTHEPGLYGAAAESLALAEVTRQLIRNAGPRGRLRAEMRGDEVVLVRRDQEPTLPGLEEVRSISRSVSEEKIGTRANKAFFFSKRFARAASVSPAAIRIAMVVMLSLPPRSFARAMREVVTFVVSSDSKAVEISSTDER